jgi:hypothetical protein
MRGPDRILPEAPSKTRRLRTSAVLLLGLLCASGPYVLWDPITLSVSSHDARAKLSQGTATEKRHAIVALLRDTQRSIEALQAAERDEPDTAKRAAVALQYLRDQLR